MAPPTILPAVRVARHLRRHRDLGAVAMLAGCALVAGFLAAMPIHPAAARLSMSRFHLRTEPFALWAALQPVPAMYNFANRYWVSPRPLAARDLSAPPGEVETRMLNHYPPRIFTFGFERLRHVSAGERWVYLESAYRDLRVRSAYHLRPGPPDAAGVVATRVEPIPWPAP